MRRIQRTSKRARQIGSSLFEVMVAVLVLSTGMLGVAAMQAASLRNNQSAVQRSQAIMLTYSIVDAMRANIASARANAYNVTMPSVSCPTPSGSGLAGADLIAWRQSITTAMGSGACGSVACDVGVCEIAIRWNDEAGSGGSSAQFLRTRSRL